MVINHPRAAFTGLFAVRHRNDDPSILKTGMTCFIKTVINKLVTLDLSDIGMDDSTARGY
ncbi:uncharacterized protein PHALS_12742 [Plasmopara halstedii]|uniref:Uncharacterized protein n=1 Tax=Plasmopara halstedii TaxID=4781 RepID=A0A0P1AMA0_PLAHL|nr:uncharacterized protein PHALS_12742 [Plasmopara halstedii]CEG42468.1 hypothetical protein PHALS_12742 [Plasmopara halstedii]|eukprot:XP_024578837.1 hypothetical protein PHALS_12742 [Plasmopara halstedii]